MSLLSLVPGLFKLADKFIEDKDKKAEFYVQMMNKMLDTKTYPWVDALVKLSYASEQIIKGLFRPIGAALMTAFGVYCHLKGIDIGPTAQVIFDGALPAWGTSRHIEKSAQKEKKPDPFEDLM